MELAELIAEQEADMRYGDTIRYSREVSLDAPITNEANSGSLAELVGDDDLALAELLGENETWVALVTQKKVTDEDVVFWRYLRKRGWTNVKIAERVGLTAATVSSHLASPPTRGSAQADALEEKLSIARRSYEAGSRLIDVATELYEEAGYASAESCYQALRRLFLDRRVAIRPQSWKHGMRARTATRETYIAYWKAQNRRARERRQRELGKCSAWTRSGIRCSRWARRGTTHCNVHAGLSGGPTVWTPDAIRTALNAWDDAHGTYPRPRDWSHAAVEHPNFKTVYGQFPSWPAAIHSARLARSWETAKAAA